MSSPLEPDSSPTAAEGASRLKRIEAQLRLMTKVFMDSADPIIIRDLDESVISMETRLF